MHNGTHTLIGILRNYVEIWRKTDGMSRQSVAMLIVEAHERIGGPADTGIEFDPPTRDAYKRVAVNTDRVYRWLDDVTKETNFLPANFVKSILAALPRNLCTRAIDDYLRDLGLATRQIIDDHHAPSPAQLKLLIKEAAEAAAAYTDLLDRSTREELLEAQRQLTDLYSVIRAALHSVEVAIREA